MTVQNVSIDKVKPYPKNPRILKNAVKVVAKSIEKFGFRQPILVDKDFVIIAGHARLEAAKQLGLTEVPVIVCSDLTPAQVKAYRLADNKTAEEASWDMSGLAEELKSITDFDMRDFGFTDFAINFDKAQEVLTNPDNYKQPVEEPEPEPEVEQGPEPEFAEPEEGDDVITVTCPFCRKDFDVIVPPPGEYDN